VSYAASHEWHGFADASTVIDAAFKVDQFNHIVKHIAGFSRLCFAARALLAYRADCYVFGNLWHTSSMSPSSPKTV
jgi:hypothetical protein